MPGVFDGFLLSDLSKLSTKPEKRTACYSLSLLAE